MSYSRYFEAMIPVTLHGSVSYPASEHGGTMSVTLSGVEEVGVNVYVDTDELDESIDQTVLATHGLTGAVGVMNTAQCAEIFASSEKVSDKITGGFYSLINSEISVQKVENWSVLQSKAGLLLEFSKDIAEKHARMNGDILRLTKHFKQIFDNLDEDCKKRIRALDQAAFSLGENVYQDIISNPTTQIPAESFFRLKEDVDNNNAITGSIVKKRASNVIDFFTDSIKNQNRLDNVIEEMAENIQVPYNVDEKIPVLYSEGENQNLTVYVPEFPDREKIASKVQEMVSGENRWETKNLQETSQIDFAFSQLLQKNFGNNTAEENEYDRRVGSVLSQLWAQNRESLFNLCEK